MAATMRKSCYNLLGLLFLPMAFSSVSIGQMFPFGINNGDSRLPTNLDNFEQATFVNGNFGFFNATYTKSFVSSNGLISFISGVTQFTPTCGPLGLPIIAPYWADTDPRIGGETFYRESKNSTLLLRASQEIQRAYPEISNLQLNWMFITTWSEMAFYGATSCNGMGIRNTFQAILTTDGRHSFASFYYNKIDWTTGTDSGGNCTGQGGIPAKAGFDLGDGETFYSIPGTCTPEIGKITDTSNINDPGKWIFRVDESVDEPPTLPPTSTTPKPTTTTTTTPKPTTSTTTTPKPTTTSTTTTPEPTMPPTEPSTTEPPHECDTATIPPEGPWDFVCPVASGNFQDVCDCRFYYACDNWQVSGHIRCPEGLLFNPIINNCDYAWNVDCDDRRSIGIKYLNVKR